MECLLFMALMSFSQLIVKQQFEKLRNRQNVVWEVTKLLTAIRYVLPSTKQACIIARSCLPSWQNIDLNSLSCRRAIYFVERLCLLIKKEVLVLVTK